MPDIREIRSKLSEYGLKITPQRIAIYSALLESKTHPTADRIITHVQRKHPNISQGTIYKTLETFIEKGLIKKVKTDKDVMRYDSILENHHHLYCAESDRIEDYFDDDLNNLLEEYFRKKKIPDFTVEDIKLQIIGKFTDKQK